jgi:hypothetical protein
VEVPHPRRGEITRLVFACFVGGSVALSPIVQSVVRSPAIHSRKEWKYLILNKARPSLALVVY